MHSGATICVGNYSELLSEHVLSIGEMCACNQQKDLISASMTSMFCVLWIGGEVAPEICREVQGIQWLPLPENLGGLGKRTYIVFVTPQWASAWRSLVCEGLSRRTERVGIARAVGAAIAGGTIKIRVQLMAQIIIIL